MEQQELIVASPQPSEAIVPTSTSATPVELLRIAVSQNADIDKLTKLMDLQERWERNEARKAFVVAMAAFKSDPPKILKDKHVKIEFKSGGGMEYDHATLANVCKAITAGLGKHGISHRWKIEQPEGIIRVTCVLTHEAGHSEETILIGVPDTSGQKNPIQQVGSTVTYLQRYTLLAACGLAAADNDDDAVGKPPLPTEIKKKESNGSEAPSPQPVASVAPPAAPPRPAPTAAAPVERPPIQSPRPPAVRMASEPQWRRFYAKCKAADKSKDMMTEYLRSIGASEGQIPLSRYEEACDWADAEF